MTGERKFDKEVKEEGYYRKESSYGSFERHVSLPKGIKESDIKAEYDNGVLEISVPRQPDQRQAAGEDDPRQDPRQARQGLNARRRRFQRDRNLSGPFLTSGCAGNDAR